MKRQLRALLPFLLCALTVFAADDYQPGPDSLPQPGVPKGEMLKDKYIAAEGSVFPGTEREYQIYLPAGLDTSKPAPFMVFQDGVIYQAPVVFDNLIAKKEIPPLIGIFIKPGVVPAANDNALPRFNRSYEYDSVTDNYSRFLIDEFLPAIKARHKLNLSDDPNARGIAGSSSGGICAFMVAWHRPDSFRRVFTSVGTYVGIHGADQLPVLVRKYEPKPIRIHLQSGENDNNLYCGDWWMANQMMERSLTWNGYDVNHTWGTGGHNQKHATAIFPDVLRWLWKGYPDEPVKANPRRDAKWRGYEVLGDGGWKQITRTGLPDQAYRLCAAQDGRVFFLPLEGWISSIRAIDIKGELVEYKVPELESRCVAVNGSELVVGSGSTIKQTMVYLDLNHGLREKRRKDFGKVLYEITFDHEGRLYFSRTFDFADDDLAVVANQKTDRLLPIQTLPGSGPVSLTLSPDQTQVYLRDPDDRHVYAVALTPGVEKADENFFLLETFGSRGEQVARSGLCVDTNGWLYVATSLGIQVCDQAGRVNFIIPTPEQPYDVCFGGKDLSELFIACGDTIYKRKTKAHGYISGQMAPIKPPPPKL